jgi:hypothetical protein
MTSSFLFFYFFKRRTDVYCIVPTTLALNLFHQWRKYKESTNRSQWNEEGNGTIYERIVAKMATMNR